MKLGIKHAMFAAFMSSLVVSGVAMGAEAQTLADSAKVVKEQVTGLKDLMLALFGFLGLVLVGVGLFFFYKESKEEGRGHAKKGLFALIVGILLIGIMGVVALGSNSVGLSGAEATQTVNRI